MLALTSTFWPRVNERTRRFLRNCLCVCYGKCSKLVTFNYSFLSFSFLPFFRTGIVQVQDRKSLRQPLIGLFVHRNIAYFSCSLNTRNFWKYVTFAVKTNTPACSKKSSNVAMMYGCSIERLRRDQLCHNRQISSPFRTNGVRRPNCAQRFFLQSSRREVNRE